MKRKKVEVTSVSIFRVSIFHLRTNLKQYSVLNLREKRRNKNDIEASRRRDIPARKCGKRNTIVDEGTSTSYNMERTNLKYK